MIEIFIPVLVICINDNCEFHYTVEAQCKASLDMQKQHMRNLIKESGQGQAKVLEGTCINATVDARSKTEKDI